MSALQLPLPARQLQFKGKEHAPSIHSLVFHPPIALSSCPWFLISSFHPSTQLPHPSIQPSVSDCYWSILLSIQSIHLLHCLIHLLFTPKPIFLPVHCPTYAPIHLSSCQFPHPSTHSPPSSRPSTHLPPTPLPTSLSACLLVHPLLTPHS